MIQQWLALSRLRVVWCVRWHKATLSTLTDIHSRRTKENTDAELHVQLNCDILARDCILICSVKVTATFWHENF